jgi:hypothetical protein
VKIEDEVLKFDMFAKGKNKLIMSKTKKNKNNPEHSKKKE